MLLLVYIIFFGLIARTVEKIYLNFVFLTTLLTFRTRVIALHFKYNVTSQAISGDFAALSNFY